MPTKTTTSVTTKTSGPVQTQGSKPALKSSQYFLDEYEKLVTDPQYQRTAPPAVKESLAAAIEKAQSSHNERANRNDWLEVAQTLAQAVTKYGAARSGGDSVNMSGVSAGPGIDYGARTTRSGQEMDRSISAAKDIGNAEMADWNNASKPAAEKFDNQKGYLTTAIKTASERESDADRSARAEQAEIRRITTEENNNKNANDKEAARIRSERLKDLRDEEKTLTKQLKSAQAFFNNKEVQDDLTSKKEAEIVAKYGNQAADAGIDLGEYTSKLDSTAEDGGSEEGTLWGTNRAPAKVKTLNQTYLTNIKQALDAIKAEKKQLTSGVDAANAVPAAEPETVTIQSPDGETQQVKRSEAQKYIDKGGKIVP